MTCSTDWRELDGDVLRLLAERPSGLSFEEIEDKIGMSKDGRPERIGRGTAVGYTGAYVEPGTVDIREVVAVQNARGPE